MFPLIEPATATQDEAISTAVKGCTYFMEAFLTFFSLTNLNHLNLTS